MAKKHRYLFVETSPFYDPTQADWRGRYASARLSVTW